MDFVVGLFQRLPFWPSVKALGVSNGVSEEMLVALPDHHARARKDTRRRISLASLADEPVDDPSCSCAVLLGVD